jgi:hypothetical protein
VSLRLLRDAATNPSVEQVVRTALRLDSSFLQRSGTGGEPLGIKNMSGVTAGPSLGANGRSSFDDLKAIPASLRALNAPFQRPGWIFHSRLLATSGWPRRFGRRLGVDA